MKTVLTIAGSDCSGGAGIQADLKTMIMNGVYGMSAITAMTAQNTMGLTAVQEATPDFMRQQIEAVFEDIRPDAVKIGMIPNGQMVHVIAECLKQYKATNIVVDPVMVASTGKRLSDSDYLLALCHDLLPLCRLVTPNLSEAEILSKHKIICSEDMIQAAATIGQTYDCAVLVKGGHRIQDANDLLYDHGKFIWYESARINNSNTHGTGCTLSSAIASNLAKGYDLEESVQRGKDYITEAIGAMLDLGKGNGPMNHGYCAEGKWTI